MEYIDKTWQTATVMRHAISILNSEKIRVEHVGLSHIFSRIFREAAGFSCLRIKKICYKWFGGKEIFYYLHYTYKET